MGARVSSGCGYPIIHSLSRAFESTFVTQPGLLEIDRPLHLACFVEELLLGSVCLCRRPVVGRTGLVHQRGIHVIGVLWRKYGHSVRSSSGSAGHRTEF